MWKVFSSDLRFYSSIATHIRVHHHFSSFFWVLASSFFWVLFFSECWGSYRGKCFLPGSKLYLGHYFQPNLHIKTTFNGWSYWKRLTAHLFPVTIIEYHLFLQFFIFIWVIFPALGCNPKCMYLLNKMKWSYLLNQEHNSDFILWNNLPINIWNSSESIFNITLSSPPFHIFQHRQFLIFLPIKVQWFQHRQASSTIIVLLTIFAYKVFPVQKGFT